MTQGNSVHSTPPTNTAISQNRDLSGTLIEKFASLYGDIEAFRPTYDAALERREAELTRLTGILPHWGFRTDDEATEHLAAMKIVDEAIGFNDLNEKMEALWARLDPVVKIITAAPARNLADLALKANAAATAWEELWMERVAGESRLP
jgi:hypothetical protein